MKEETLKVIATIHTPYPQKFGIPRQSGMVEGLCSEIVFEPDYRDPNAVRGLEGFSHIWVLWQFSKAKTDSWSPTVRPPRLGGNKRMGVFATRSPFRPNAIGLSSLKLEKVVLTEDRGPVLYVSGADYIIESDVYLLGKVRAITIPEDHGVDIDTLMDFQQAELILDEKLKRK